MSQKDSTSLESQYECNMFPDMPSDEEQGESEGLQDDVTIDAFLGSDYDKLSEALKQLNAELNKGILSYSSNRAKDYLRIIGTERKNYDFIIRKLAAAAENNGYELPLGLLDIAEQRMRKIEHGLSNLRLTCSYILPKIRKALAPSNDDADTLIHGNKVHYRMTPEQLQAIYTINQQFGQ